MVLSSKNIRYIVNQRRNQKKRQNESNLNMGSKLGWKNKDPSTKMGFVIDYA